MNPVASEPGRTCRRSITAIVLALVAAPAALLPPFAQAAESWSPELMPRDEEIAAALEAGPPTVREAAGVYLLTAAGFERVRDSRNGFNCLVERSQPGAFEPQCFDAEGSATLLPGVLLAARLRMAGSSPGEVARAVGEAWARGELRAPRRPGVNYMLSERNRVPIDAETVIPYRPHLMFYVPYLDDADLGGDPRGASPLFVINGGEPGAYAIVPVPQE
jgi:hypothetical protein